ncbi:hypothetical protein M378DRAFT_213687 [Amanita muscaria Koide BX008]|uniref:Uncharacterized protein n=1 Tax=Amanita muscaria (strain Koide BX008) TaxID=946122 RepID=A0A0C2XP18_AMAMK|nr:hypothetical protein M378DRAFT_213687 [Amanita muscaria Koide BX008]
MVLFRQEHSLRMSIKVISSVNKFESYKNSFLVSNEHKYSGHRIGMRLMLDRSHTRCLLVPLALAYNISGKLP